MRSVREGGVGVIWERELRPVAISYSGGKSSRWLVEAVIRGEIKRPGRVAVFFADTGEEHAWTYRDVDETERRCEDAGLTFVRCKEPGLSLGAHMLYALGGLTAKRIDNPPLWIDKGDGQRGQLIQKCTKKFKTAPLRRAKRRWLRNMGLRPGLVSWIGFAADETSRAQRALAKIGVAWERLDFPAIRLGKTRAQQKADLIAWIGHAPRFSMCVCCPYKTPARWGATRGKDLARAVELDNAIRDLDQVGITDGPGFLSDRLKPLSELQKAHLRGLLYEEDPNDFFDVDDADPADCSAGVCFT